MQDKSVWFGTRDDMVQVKCPSTGLTRVPTSWRTNGTFLSGGGYARSSGTAHTDAAISWGGDSVDDFATLLTQLNKDEPLHYLDPLSAKTNVLPPYAAQYTRNNPQGATEAAGVGGNGYPAKAAAYSQETLIGSAFVPEGYNLWVGAHGTGGLRVDTGLPTPAPVELRRNMANNPRFTRTSGTVEVRRNLFNNPGAAFSFWQGFGAYAGKNNIVSPSVSDASWSLSGKAVRRTWTTVESPNSGDMSVKMNPASSGVVASTIYTIVVKTVTDGTVELGFPVFYDTTAGQIFTLACSRTTDVTPLAGEVVTDWITVTTPTAFNDTRFGFTVGNKTAGCWVEQSEVDIYPGEYQPNRKWFSGSYSPDPDLTPVWVGAENASQSYLRGFVPGNASSNNIAFSVASQNNGMRLIPNSTTSTDSNTSVGGTAYSLSGYGVTFTPGKWYGVQAVCTLLAPQTGSLHSSARRIQLASNNVAGWTGAIQPISVQPPNEAGSYQEEIVTQLPADSIWALLRLNNGASFGNGDVYWDKLLIVEGDTEEEVRSKLAQGYFDGTNASLPLPTGGEIDYRFVGADNDSASVEERVEAPSTSTSIPISSPVRVNSAYTGVGSFYDIYATAGSTLNGVIAQVLPANETPSTGGFVPGMGFSALRLKEDPQITEYSAVLDNYHIAMTANFTEVGSWES